MLVEGIVGVRAQFRRLESGMEVFDPSSRLVIGNGGVRAKFDAWNRKWRSLSQVPTLGFGNGVYTPFYIFSRPHMCWN